MSNNNSEMTHETKVQKLKRQRIRQMITSALGIGVLLWGVVKVTMLFLDYKKTETCNDAQVEQYLAPVNVRATGYIKCISPNISACRRATPCLCSTTVNIASE